MKRSAMREKDSHTAGVRVTFGQVQRAVERKEESQQVHKMQGCFFTAAVQRNEQDRCAFLPV